MDISEVVTYDKSWCVQLDQSKMCLIAIVFRSWSYSFRPVEVVDQSVVQNSQTVLVALLSLMLLMKVSNADSRGESSVCPLYQRSFLLFWGEWDCLSTGCISQYLQSLQIHRLSCTFSISAVHFHEEWVGHVLSMQILVHFRIRRERQKREGLKPTWGLTYLLWQLPMSLLLSAQHSHLLERG